MTVSGTVFYFDYLALTSYRVHNDRPDLGQTWSQLVVKLGFNSRMFISEMPVTVFNHSDFSKGKQTSV